jgi:ribonuclease-3
VKVSGVEIGSGKGYSKKESHQMAAKVALKKLRESNELQEVIAEAANESSSDAEDSSLKFTLPDLDDITTKEED